MLYVISAALLCGALFLSCAAPCESGDDVTTCGVSCTPGSDAGCPQGTTCQQRGGYWQCVGKDGAK